MVARSTLIQGVTMRALSTIKYRIRVSDDGRFLTIGQVRERFGVSDMWVWRYMRRHGFPKPLQFGGPTSARHWPLSDIETWERERAPKQLQAPSRRLHPSPHAAPKEIS
jgi:predicted DNA-binding transcriptional regulator AlpA